VGRRCGAPLVGWYRPSGGVPRTSAAEPY
jgi:hypothetical protein